MSETIIDDQDQFPYVIRGNMEFPEVVDRRDDHVVCMYGSLDTAVSVGAALNEEHQRFLRKLEGQEDG